MAAFKIRPVLTIILIFLPALALAETVTLKSGKVIEGPIIEQTDQYIRLDTSLGPLYFERKFIKEITQDKAKETPGPDESLIAALEAGRDGAIEKTKELLEKAGELYPEDGNIKGALELIQEQEKGAITKEFVTALFGGSLAMMKEQYPEARDYFLKALSFKPDDPDISFNLALAYYNLKDYAKGIDCLKKIILINAFDADAYALMGSFYYDSKDFKLAKESLLVAKELFKKDKNEEGIHEINLMLTALSAQETSKPSL
jgi:tetratricopeptide (TPR) repeat protein